MLSGRGKRQPTPLSDKCQRLYLTRGVVFDVQKDRHLSLLIVAFAFLPRLSSKIISNDLDRRS
jgi:hypothetical protein